jgi:hypothetical protein
MVVLEVEVTAQILLREDEMSSLRMIWDEMSSLRMIWDEMSSLRMGWADLFRLDNLDNPIQSIPSLPLRSSVVT